MVYTFGERIEIIFAYGVQNGCARRTARVFNARHPEKNVTHSYVMKLVRKFEEIGSVCNKKNTRPRILDEVAQVEVLGHFAADPTMSIRKVSNVTNISIGSVQKVLKKNKFFPYKIQIHQQLSADDYDRKIEFCEYLKKSLEILVLSIIPVSATSPLFSLTGLLTDITVDTGIMKTRTCSAKIIPSFRKKLMYGLVFLGMKSLVLFSLKRT